MSPSKAMTATGSPASSITLSSTYVDDVVTGSELGDTTRTSWVQLSPTFRGRSGKTGWACSKYDWKSISPNSGRAVSTPPTERTLPCGVIWTVSWTLSGRSSLFWPARESWSRWNVHTST